MARVAMFLARSPGLPLTGRKAVIRSAIEALGAEGHEVDLFVLARQACAPAGAARAVALGTVPAARMLCNAALAIASGRESLNEAIFRSPRILAYARGLRGRYDFAIADTLRAAPYACAVGVPWHLDLDDLLSRRYEAYLQSAERPSARTLLGYYRDSVPRVVSAIPAPLLARLLGREAAQLRRREIYWARRATSVSLVSPEEASHFARAAGRPVHSLPMSIALPAQRWMPGAAGGARGAFLGTLDYKPNLDALLHYQEAIFPVLSAGSGRAPALHHIGYAPADLRRRFRAEVVHFEGYVSDVAPRLREAHFFVAPIVNGGGIKTKVLEAMALGMPVLATREAVSGLDVQHRTHFFGCERPAEFAEGMRYLSDPGVAERMGDAARHYVQANFSIEVVRQRWREVAAQLMASARHAARGAGAMQGG